MSYLLGCNGFARNTSLFHDDHPNEKLEVNKIKQLMMTYEERKKMSEAIKAKEMTFSSEEPNSVSWMHYIIIYKCLINRKI